MTAPTPELGTTTAATGTAPAATITVTAAQVNENGFPDNTPWADMAPDQQVKYWQHQARKHEGRATARGDYDQVKAERDALKQATQTPDEKAIEAARNEGAAAARRELGSQAVDVHVRALASVGRLTSDAAEVILDGLDRTKYLTASGDLDLDKLAGFLNVVAPQATAPSRDPHQGTRQSGQVRQSGLAAGAEMFANRKKPTTS